MRTWRVVWSTSSLPPEIKAALRKAAIEKVVPNWVDRVGGADTDAVRMYNTYVAPLLGVSIDSNGKAVEN